MRVIFTPEIDALIRELRRLSDNYKRFDPFEGRLGKLMLSARDDRSLLPELHECLSARRAEIDEHQ